MATTIKRVGFGQVEPNHLSAQRTSQIYAQLPAKSYILFASVFASAVPVYIIGI